MPSVDLSNPNIWNQKYLPCVVSPLRFNNLWGGAGSGKSQTMIQFFLMEIMDQKANQNEIFFVFRKTHSSLRDSTFPDFVKKIREWEIEHLVKIRGGSTGPFAISCGTNEIRFKGLDDSQKIKSLAQSKYIWNEEVTEFSLEDFTQITARQRGLRKTQAKVFNTFNPISDTHWIKKRFFDKPPENQINQILNIHSTYRDALDFLNPEYSQEMQDLKETMPLFWEIYCNGNWGVIDRESLFATEFKEEKHVIKGSWGASKRLPLYLSFDFNASKYGSNTNTCVVAQLVKNELPNEYWAEANILKTYRIADMEELCTTIKHDYPGFEYHVNGDASGSSANPLTENNISSYQLIVNYLGISPEFQLHVPNGNLRHISSRLHTNLALKKCIIRIFDGFDDITNHNHELIADLKSAKMTKGSLETWKKDNPTMGHCFDAFRYFISANFYEMATDMNLGEFNEKIERMSD